jgi:putative hydrolase of the HAD superfamily
MEEAGAAGVRALWPSLPQDVVEHAASRFRADPTGAFRRFVAGESTFAQMRSARLRDVASCFGQVWRDGMREDFETAYAPVFDASLAAYADSAPLLAWAATRGLPVRVLTNSAQAYTEAKLEATGLRELAGLVCSRDCIGVGKPEPAVFHHACARLGFAPEEVLYVGDEWSADARGAADAGLEAAWLVRDDGDPAGEVVATQARRAEAGARGIRVIGSLAEVSDLLVG